MRGIVQKCALTKCIYKPNGRLCWIISRFSPGLWNKPAEPFPDLLKLSASVQRPCFYYSKYPTAGTSDSSWAFYTNNMQNVVLSENKSPPCKPLNQLVLAYSKIHLMIKRTKTICHVKAYPHYFCVSNISLLWKWRIRLTIIFQYQQICRWFSCLISPSLCR